MTAACAPLETSFSPYPLGVPWLADHDTALDRQRAPGQPASDHSPSHDGQEAAEPEPGDLLAPKRAIEQYRLEDRHAECA